VPAGDETQGWRRAFLFAAQAVVIVYVALDSIATPIFRPLVRWTAKLRLIIRLQDLVAHLPPYGVLAFLAVPFAIAEPAKIYALVLVATGHPVLGLVVFALAYLISFVVMERIYRAGEAKLRTITWFARLTDWLFGIRDRLIAWAKSTEIWAFAARVKQKARMLAAQIRLRLGLG